MRKCKLCGKLHTDLPQYCDCGGDEFEEVAVSEDKTSNTETFKNVLSWVIFAVCIVLSVLVLFLW